MEMGWLETIKLIGLDLQMAVIGALVGLEFLERALKAGWLCRHRDYRVQPLAVDRQPARIAIRDPRHA